MRGLTVFIAILVALCVGTNAYADKRIALVIGNSAYQHAPELKNPRSDASDMASALKALKFQVVEGVDLDKRAMEITIRKFAVGLKNADIALFFYAGHGLQVSGQNYLVPVDARLEDAHGLDFEMIRLDLVHRAMERETKTNLIFLDACRDNPLARNLARAMGTRSSDIGHGLAPVESGVGTLISFSTQPGNVALDGDGRNSPFAGALVKRLTTEGEDLSSILIAVRNDVMDATRNRQIPWEHSALRSKFFFSAPATKSNTQSEIELAYWTAAQVSGNAGAFKTYLERYPNGAYAASAKLMIDKLREEEGSKGALASREEELRKAEETKRLAEAKLAEEQKKREETKRSEELAKALEEVRRAQEALRAAEAERLAALKGAEEARKQAEAANASVKMANLPQNAQPPSSQPPTSDPKALARSLQTELKRVGCDPGRIDGTWTPKASTALSDFARITKKSMPNDAPTEAALALVSGHKSQVCISAPPVAKPRVQQVERAPANSEKKSGESKGLDWGSTSTTCLGPAAGAPWCPKR